MLVYKLTDQKMQTYCGFQWELGKAYTTSGNGDLCGEGWLHAYEDPLLAVLHNPIHGGFKGPRMFRAETGSGKIKRDGWMKIGASEMTLTEEMVLPVFTTNQLVAYAIYCGQAVRRERGWQKWAAGWLSGKDRTYAAAAAAAAAYAAAYATAYATAYAAATNAAYAAANAAAYTAANDAATNAAYAAANAAAIDLRALAQRAHLFEAAK